MLLSFRRGQGREKCLLIMNDLELIKSSINDRINWEKCQKFYIGKTNDSILIMNHKEIILRKVVVT